MIVSILFFGELFSNLVSVDASCSVMDLTASCWITEDFKAFVHLH